MLYPALYGATIFVIRFWVSLLCLASDKQNTASAETAFCIRRGFTKCQKLQLGAETGLAPATFSL